MIESPLTRRNDCSLFTVGYLILVFLEKPLEEFIYYFMTLFTL